MKLICKLTVVLFFLAHLANAQLVTENTKSADELVRNVLAGGGVVISNVTYSGESKAIGEFFGASSNIGLPQGIIMSTGTILNEKTPTGLQNGPIGPNNNPSAQTKNNTPGDADLSALVGGKTSGDAAILEFDFVPEGDTIKFRYVFASEEYPQWVNSGNNDAFGFFISGAGIVGKKNIALLPDNVTPVSIDNVNIGKNSSYFVNNGSGVSGTPQFTNSNTVNFNGFTTVLEAVSVVVPCQTYHLKIVISDIGDLNYDSGVFLEANSLNSAPKFKIEQNVDYSPSGSVNSLFEDCSNGELNISREKDLSSSLTIPFKIYGTAKSGIDYTTIPAQITFLPNEKVKTIFLETIQDGILEGDETLILRFRNPSICENDSIDVIYTIKDQTPLITVSGTESVICPGESVNVNAVVTDGIPIYTYSWIGITSTSNTISVSPVVTSVYKYSVTDACGQTATDSVSVNVPIYLPISSVPMADQTIRCPGTVLDFEVQAINGAGNYTYLWSNGEKTKLISSEILSDIVFTVDITDQCGNSTQDNVSIAVNYPVFSAKAANDTTICYGDQISLRGEGFGGIPPYQYYWNGTLGQVYNHTGVETQNLYFSIYDSCAIIPAIDTMLLTIQKPLAKFEVNAPLPEPMQKVSFLNISENASQYIWDFGNLETSTEAKPNTRYRDTGLYDVSLIAIDNLQCRDTAYQSVQILTPFYLFFPNAFSPDGNTLNDLFLGVSDGITDYSLAIFDRWGNQLFFTNNPYEGWDGTTLSGAKAPADIYVVKCKAKSDFRSDKEYDVMTFVMLLR